MNPVRSERDSTGLACRIRRHSLKMVHRAGASHIGGCLSAADLLAQLYGGWLRVDPERPEWLDRDRFILSKGHVAAALYATLAEIGFFPRHWLDSYCADGAKLGGHVMHRGVPGVEVSTGSLGHGLPIALGMALGLKRDQRAARVVVLLSDGECDEGSNWEAALLAPQLRLDNLVVIIDCNRFQGLGRTDEVAALEPLGAKWSAFRWKVIELDGHDHNQIAGALAAIPFEMDRPSLILAHTIKGKGVSFMEDELAWHYKSPDDAQLAAALREIDAQEEKCRSRSSSLSPAEASSLVINTEVS
ncbi:MAG: transketolase [Planctomycetes bacterium]|nr:transketolase [Planctomycetota bacterium]